MASLALHYENRHQIRDSKSKTEKTEPAKSRQHISNKFIYNENPTPDSNYLRSSVSRAEVGSGSHLITSPGRSKKIGFKTSTTPTPTNLTLVNRVKSVDAVTNGGATINLTSSYPNTSITASSPTKKTIIVSTSANATHVHLTRTSSIQSSSNTSTTIPIQTSPSLERKYHNYNFPHHQSPSRVGSHHIVYQENERPVKPSGLVNNGYIYTSNNHIPADVYHDKISDAKFFNRNYRVKPNDSCAAPLNCDNLNISNLSSPIMELYPKQHHYHQTSPSLPQRKVYTSYGDREPSKMSFYSSNNNYQQTTLAASASNTVAAATATVNNRLKLLKKRNALKKTLSSANGAGLIDEPSNAYETTLINSVGRDDYRSQNSLNRTSVYLSRNSLNTNFEQISHHISNETINNNDEARSTNLSRVKSTPHINQMVANAGNNHHSISNINGSKLNGTQRTKSENEISSLSEGYKLRKPVGNPAPHHRTEARSKEQLVNSRDNDDEFTILCPNVGAGYASQNSQNLRKSQPQSKVQFPEQVLTPAVKAAALQSMNSNLPVELFEASPYNIMSDPVICEQFRKLYEEDEYFQNVHRKCVEWLKKYVFCDYESV